MKKGGNIEERTAWGAASRLKFDENGLLMDEEMLVVQNRINFVSGSVRIGKHLFLGTMADNELLVCKI